MQIVALLARCAWCLVAGWGSSLAFPPHGAWWVVWFSVAPWLVSLRGARVAEALLLSSIFGLSLALPLGAWIPATIEEGFRGSRAGGYGLWLAAGLAYLPPILVLAVGLRHVPGRSWLYPLCAGSGWALVELSYSFVWPQVPWVLLGATQIDAPIAAGGALVGVHGVSAVLVTWNAVLAQLVLRESSRSAAYVTAFVAAALLVASVQGAEPVEAGRRTLRVALVQPAVSVREHPDSVFQDASVTALIELTTALPPVDLVLWPENALSATLEGRPDLAARIGELAERIEAPIWLGVHRGSSASRVNGVTRISRDSAPQPIYAKTRLLPMAESHPAWLPAGARRALGRLVPPIPFVSAGPPVRTEPPAGLFLCFESAFSGVEHPADAPFLVNLVNDGWYDRTSAAQHLLLLSSWRAIEAQAPLLRVATTGVTAVIEPSGRIREALPVAQRGALIAEVPLEGAITLFERTGNVPLAAAATLIWGWALTRTRRATRPAFLRSAL